MNSQYPYSQSWKQTQHPAQLILADFSNAHKNISFKKTLTEIIISLVLFVAFAFGLNWVDEKYQPKHESSQFFQVVPAAKAQEFNRIHQYFQEGYIGRSTVSQPQIRLDFNNLT